jgi:hypothetical protein
MSEVRKGTSTNMGNENKRYKIFNKVLNMNWDYVRGKQNQKENKKKTNKKTLIYYITNQRVCETISIIKMLTISKNLVWPRDLESFKGGKFSTLSLVDCYVQICNGTAVEHGNLLNCSGVCDGINCCHGATPSFCLLLTF